MATASSTLVTSKVAGKGNRQFDLKAKAALGVAILGCAAALAFGGPQARDADRTQTLPAGPVAAGAGQESDQVAWLAGFQITGQIAPAERHGADQVAWLEQFQLAEAEAQGVDDGGDQLAWLERFQLTR